jgi:hypothetical protein
MGKERGNYHLTYFPTLVGRSAAFRGSPDDLKLDFLCVVLSFATVVISDLGRERERER